MLLKSILVLLIAVAVTTTTAHSSPALEGGAGEGIPAILRLTFAALLQFSPYWRARR